MVVCIVPVTPQDGGFVRPSDAVRGWLCRCSHSAGVRLVSCMGTVDQGWWVRSFVGLLRAAAGISCALPCWRGFCGSSSVWWGVWLSTRLTDPGEAQHKPNFPVCSTCDFQKRRCQMWLSVVCVCQTYLASHKSTGRFVQIGSLRFSEMHATL